MTFRLCPGPLSRCRGSEPGHRPQDRLPIQRFTRCTGAYRTGSDRTERIMPLINVKLIEGVFSPQQKQEIIRKLTDTMVEIEGEAMRAVTWTVVEEVKSGDWGIAGKPLTTSDVKALAAVRPAKAA